MLYLEKKEKKKYSPPHPPIKNKKKKEYSHVVSARARARKNFLVEFLFFVKSIFKSTGDARVKGQIKGRIKPDVLSALSQKINRPQGLLSLPLRHNSI